MLARRVYFDAINQVSLHQDNIQPKANEVLVKTHMSSICGTDKNYLQGYMPKPKRVMSLSTEYDASEEPFPRTVGHEGAGTIVEVGSAVTDFKVGDKVMSFGVFATMSDYFVAPVTPKGKSILKVPDGLSMDEAALGEPTACAIYAGMESGVRLGDTVLVVGMGFAGQVIAQVAKKMGAKKVIVCDLVDEKLKLAKALGADIVVNTATEDAVEVVLAETHGKGVDVAFEVAGNEEAIQICTDSVKHGGILGFYSWVLHPVNLLIDRWHDDGLEIRTLAVMHRIMHDMEWYQLNALSNVVNGNINIKDLMTHTFDLNDAAKAFECAIHEPTACKVLIRG